MLIEGDSCTITLMYFLMNSEIIFIIQIKLVVLLFHTTLCRCSFVCTLRVAWILLFLLAGQGIGSFGAFLRDLVLLHWLLLLFQLLLHFGQQPLLIRAAFHHGQRLFRNEILAAIGGRFKDRRYSVQVHQRVSGTCT